MSNDFMELLETVRSEDATVSRLFGDAGRGIRSMRRDDPRYLRSLGEAAALIDSVVRGRVPMYRIQEAMSTSDFPYLFGDIIDRALLGAYNEWPSVWARVAQRGTVRDFRTVRKFYTNGAEAVLTAVPQGTEYPEAGLTEGKYDYSVTKYGRRVPFTWEAFINDDLGAFQQTPNRLAKAARMSEDRFFTELFVDSTGPDSTFFSSGNGNKLTGGTSTLTVAGLAAAFAALNAQLDADGNPIYPGNVRLVVPPALEVTANNIANATEIRSSAGSSSSTADLVTTSNWMTNRISEVVVDPWLPIIDTSANKNTTWYLFSDPGTGRPALEMGFLRGHESPELFMKSPNAVRVGGGLVGAEEGSFETDGVDYKIRHVFGGSLMDYRGAVASVGA